MCQVFVSWTADYSRHCGRYPAGGIREKDLPMPRINWSPMRLPLTPLQAFRAKWEDCTACYLSEGRSGKAVLCRGTYPCDILFIAEAPGNSEDVIGIPMVGPAGNLLNHIIDRAIPETITYAVTNVICCIPRDEDGIKLSTPSAESIDACAPRLQEFVKLCEPQLIVCTGKVAKENLEKGFKHSIKFHREIPMVSIDHPAAILRANVSYQGLMIQKCVIAIRNGIEDHVRVSE